MFNNIIGNEENKKALENAINKENISHSYMFIGKTGIGKFLFAKEFAKAILCQEDKKPCNRCEECITFDQNNNPDIVIIDEEEKSIKTDTIKNMVKDVYEKPLKGYKKIYIINNSEKMTKEAQNSLLKTLEEPPVYVVMILITENENLLLNTIKSRCTKINFKSLTINELRNILEEKYNFQNISENILKIAEGSVRRAISALDNQNTINLITDIFSKIEKINVIDMLNAKEEIFKDKENTEEILNYINIILHSKIKENIKYINSIKIVEETKERLKKNSNFDMTIDNLLLRVWEEVNG